MDLMNPVNRPKVLKYATDWDGDLALAAAHREKRKQHRQSLIDSIGK